MTVNLSSCTFNNSTYDLLEKGLSFVPRPGQILACDIISEQEKLIKNIKIKSIRLAKNRENTSNNTVTYPNSQRRNNRFTEPKAWNPPSHLVPADTLRLVDDIRETTSKMIDSIAKRSANTKTDGSNYKLGVGGRNYTWKMNNKDPDNLKPEERDSLWELKNNPDIIIKPADKGGATIIMDKIAYQNEAERQLNNSKYYHKINTSLAKNNKLKILEIFEKIHGKGKITKAQLNYLTGPDNYDIRKFYMLPKIHKAKEKWPNPNMPEGRPIISDVNSESYRAAEYIDSFTNPLSMDNPVVLKNSYEFIDKIRGKPFPSGYLLVTGDVKSLYTNMNLNRILEITKQTFLQNPDANRPDDELIALLELTLYNNDFEFNGELYLQVHGIAMGKKYAPGLANLYLKSFDNDAQTKFDYNPEFYFRFLDDVFFVWGHGMERLLKFQDYLNNLIPDIEITFEFHETTIPFLDIHLYIENNTIHTKTYFKPTDTHQLLHKKSYHPNHTTKGILKSQLIRFKRLSSTYKNYSETCSILFSFLKSRGYTASLFRKLKYAIWYNDQVQPSDNQKPMLPVILPYSGLAQNISNKYRHLLNTDKLLKNFKIISAYRIYPNLKQLLVSSKFNKIIPTRNENTEGFRRCTSTTCVFCIKYSFDCNYFTSTSNGKKFKINDSLNCNSVNLIYLITCKRCKIQYVGETGMPLKNRINNHISNIKCKTQTTVATHYNLPDHSIHNVQVVGIDKIHKNREQTRKQKEKYWIEQLQTYTPLGLNNINTLI